MPFVTKVIRGQSLTDTSLFVIPSKIRKYLTNEHERLLIEGGLELVGPERCYPGTVRLFDNMHFGFLDGDCQLQAYARAHRNGWFLVRDLSKQQVEVLERIEGECRQAELDEEKRAKAELAAKRAEMRLEAERVRREKEVEAQRARDEAQKEKERKRAEKENLELQRVEAEQCRVRNERIENERIGRIKAGSEELAQLDQEVRRLKLALAEATISETDFMKRCEALLSKAEAIVQGVLPDGVQLDLPPLLSRAFKDRDPASTAQLSSKNDLRGMFLRGEISEEEYRKRSRLG